MKGTPSPENVSTKLERIAKLARQAPSMAMTTLAHHIDVDFLREAYRRTRKDGAPGVDAQTAAAYAVNLEENLQSLLDRFKTGSYKAPPVGACTFRRETVGRPDPSASRPSRTRSSRGR